MDEKYVHKIEISSISELQTEYTNLTKAINKKIIQIDNLSDKRDLISQRLSQLRPSEVKNG